MDKRRRQGGSALVEFALIVPLFFLIVFGLVQFAIIFAGFCSTAFASQVAVRYAIVHGANSSSSVSADTTAMKALVKPYLWAGLASGTTVSVSFNPDDSVGSAVSVTITITYNTGIPFSKLNQVTVGSSAQGTILF